MHQWHIIINLKVLTILFDFNILTFLPMDSPQLITIIDFTIEFKELSIIWIHELVQLNVIFDIIY